MTDYTPDESGLCRTCGGEVPHHDTTAHRLAPELARLRGLLQRVTDHYPHCDNMPPCNDEDEPLLRGEWCTWCSLVGDIDAAITPEPT